MKNTTRQLDKHASSHRVRSPHPTCTDLVTDIPVQHDASFSVHGQVGQKLDVRLDQYVLQVRERLRGAKIFRGISPEPSAVEVETLLRHLRGAAREFVVQNLHPEVLNDFHHFSQEIDRRFKPNSSRPSQVVILARILRLAQGRQSLSQYADAAEGLRKDIVGELDGCLAETWVAGLSNQLLVSKIMPIHSRNPTGSVFLEMVDRAKITERIMALQQQMERVVSEVAGLEAALPSTVPELFPPPSRLSFASSAVL
ncbi:hypothetical protein N7541_004035 [Penicillium brevicompactum]|uniref:Uncharacterized protein n=1 Tax=Penicillium brevicompactum TaxID=5074 RepID=A0A9W9V1Z1_PENBR|nr:hypothetical protein N7541_004035 [Penicillium brevicompactum]